MNSPFLASSFPVQITLLREPTVTKKRRFAPFGHNWAAHQTCLDVWYPIKACKLRQRYNTFFLLLAQASPSQMPLLACMYVEMRCKGNTRMAYTRAEPDARHFSCKFAYADRRCQFLARLLMFFSSGVGRRATAKKGGIVDKNLCWMRHASSKEKRVAMRLDYSVHLLRLRRLCVSTLTDCLDDCDHS